MPIPHNRLLQVLQKVQRPGRYIGGEWNARPPDWDAADLRVAMGFPDAYEIGMSCLGYLIVHGLINSLPGCLSERFFSPMPDMELELRKAHIPLYTLESKRPLRDFDVVAFSLQYEILATNVLNALDLGRIPLHSAARSETDPLVVAGGPVAMAPEPMAPFIDVFLPGDGEEAIPVFLAALRRLKPEGLKRPEILAELQRLPGVYVPALYDPLPGPTGRQGPPVPRDPRAQPRIATAICRDFENAFYPTAPPVPGVEATHERVVLEIMRGCPFFCRFCQAGYTRRPPRFRSVEKLLAQAKETYANTGYDTLSLASLSSADYPHLDELITCLTREFSSRKVNLSLPSLRVDEGLASLPARLATVRKSGLTLAPEAACAELRAKVNKHVKDEHLYRVAERAWQEGWRVVKLYFLVGLPGETTDDRRAIVEMAQEIAGLRRAKGRGPGRVNVTASNFVPRPHTPLQWAPMEEVETLEAIKKEPVSYTHLTLPTILRV